MKYNRLDKCPLCDSKLINGTCINTDCIIGSHAKFTYEKDGKEYQLLENGTSKEVVKDEIQQSV